MFKNIRNIIFSFIVLCSFALTLPTQTTATVVNLVPSPFDKYVYYPILILAGLSFFVLSIIIFTTLIILIVKRKDKTKKAMYLNKIKKLFIGLGVVLLTFFVTLFLLKKILMLFMGQSSAFFKEQLDIVSCYGPLCP